MWRIALLSCVLLVGCGGGGGRGTVDPPDTVYSIQGLPATFGALKEVILLADGVPVPAIDSEFVLLGQQDTGSAILLDGKWYVWAFSDGLMEVKGKIRNAFTFTEVISEETVIGSGAYRFARITSSAEGVPAPGAKISLQFSDNGATQQGIVRTQFMLSEDHKLAFTTNAVVILPATINSILYSKALVDGSLQSLPYARVIPPSATGAIIPVSVDYQQG